tara:strand:- start:11034 stop:15224 length:4191 start_codon:yes stop_codon:yes gene_type:complete
MAGDRGAVGVLANRKLAVVVSANEKGNSLPAARTPRPEARTLSGPAYRPCHALVAMTSSGAFETDALAGLGRGSKVWVEMANVSERASNESKMDFTAYAPATVVTLNTSTVEVKLNDELTVSQVPRQSVFPRNPDMLSEVPNLTQLSFLNEPSVLRNVSDRYQSNEIYTNAGPVLVAVNPFKDVSELLYGESIIEQYTNKAKTSPHVYNVVVEAYANMIKHEKDQALIISGESGAGKTETTKIALECLATVALARRSTTQGCTSRTPSIPDISSKLLSANPLLESFGNAKTSRNDNSSRFGKLTSVGFCENGGLTGARVQTYLLEKSRVVVQSKGERNYHVFYQLVAGARQGEREEWHLFDDVTKYRYCVGARNENTSSTSGCYQPVTIDGVDDVEQYCVTKRSLSAVGLSATEISSVFRTVAAILWLGNVEFEDQAVDGEDDAARVAFGDARAALNICAKLLGARPDSLEKALTTRKLQLGGGDDVLKKINALKASETRDALAKATYASLFDWLVGRVNRSFVGEEEESSSESSESLPSSTTWHTSLSVLDIYGFEQFQTNSFEQLCINYANERLQQQFNQHLFALEQNEYEAENINWQNVSFEDNAPTVDLIQGRPVGLLALLDEQCKVPKASDATFAMKCAAELVKLETQSNDDSKNITSKRDSKNKPPTFVPNLNNPESGFTIRHYAGDVSYDPTGFLDKNKDDVSCDVLRVLTSSKDEFVKTLGGYADESTESTSNDTKNKTQTKSQKKLSVGARFKAQLTSLIQKLDQCAPHFIRCVKPNHSKAPDVFDDHLVLNQLRCCGVLEVVRIAREGYPTRWEFVEFTERFGFGDVAEKESKDSKENFLKAQVTSILTAHDLPTDAYQLGTTKVFMRAGSVGRMEDLRSRRVLAATTITARFRAWTARYNFLDLKHATVTCQSMRRGKVQRNWFLRTVKSRVKAAKQLQSAFRGMTARRTVAQKKKSIVVIQCALRRWSLSRKWEKEKVERETRLEEEATRVAEQMQAEFDAKEKDAERIRVENQKEADRVEAEERAEEGVKAERIEVQRKSEASYRQLMARKANAEAEARVAAETEAEALRVAANEARAGQLDAEAKLKDFQVEANETMQAAVAKAVAEANSSSENSSSSEVSELHSRNASLERENADLRTQLAQEMKRSSSFQTRLFEAETEWSGEMAALQSALAAVRVALESGDPPDPKFMAAICGEKTSTRNIRAKASSAKTESFSPGTPEEERERTKKETEHSKILAEQHANVDDLNNEFSTRVRVFEDDCEFIMEVKEGSSSASDFDPYVELRRLGTRFDGWRREFRDRLKETKGALKRLDEFESDANADLVAAELEIANVRDRDGWGKYDGNDDDGWTDAVEDLYDRVVVPEKKKRGWGLKRALGLKR